MAEVTRARHHDGESGLEVKASELGTHHTDGTGGLLPSPCLTQFLEGLGQGEQCSASTSGFGLLHFFRHCLLSGGFSELLPPCLRPWE